MSAAGAPDGEAAGDIQILAYDDSHHEGVAALVLDIQQREFGLAATYEGQADLHDIAGFFRRGAGNFWVALQGSDIVGVVGLMDFGGGGAVRKMFVREDLRGGAPGVARMLLQALVDWAEGHGMSRLYLGTIDDFAAAQRFYRKHGFVELPEAELPGDFPAMASDRRFYRRLL